MFFSNSLVKVNRDNYKIDIFFKLIDVQLIIFFSRIFIIVK